MAHTHTYINMQVNSGGVFRAFSILQLAMHLAAQCQLSRQVL